jgi:hypothetical protein
VRRLYAVETRRENGPLVTEWSQESVRRLDRRRPRVTTALGGWPRWRVISGWEADGPGPRDLGGATPAGPR